MIILGLICAIVGAIIAQPILWEIGIVLIVIGVILELLGAFGRPVGGRRHYF